MRQAVPPRPVDGMVMECIAGHRFAGTPAEHEQARGALAAAERPRKVGSPWFDICGKSARPVDGADGESVHRVCADAIALLDRLAALERAILSSAGDEAQRDAVAIATIVVERTAAINFTHWSQHLAAAFLAQSKALADLRAAVLKLYVEDIIHANDCGQYRPAASPCDCYVTDIEALVSLVRGPAATATNEEG